MLTTYYFIYFRCHEESPLIHPVGWARRVGHQVVASQEYFDRCAMDNYLTTDCTPDMFPEYRPPPGNFVAGMKLEAVDPLNLATVCVATVMKVKLSRSSVADIQFCTNLNSILFYLLNLVYTSGVFAFQLNGQVLFKYLFFTVEHST